MLSCLYPPQRLTQHQENIQKILTDGLKDTSSFFPISFLTKYLPALLKVDIPNVRLPVSFKILSHLKSWNPINNNGDQVRVHVA